MKISTLIQLGVLGPAIFATNLGAQGLFITEEEKGLELFEEGSRNQVMEISLDVDYSHLLKSAKEKIRWMDNKVVYNTEDELDEVLTSNATLHYKFNGEWNQLPIKVMPRGDDRLRNCEFPQLKLMFQDKVLTQGTPFAKISSMKLVLPCLNYSDPRIRDENRWVYREYFIYQSYNLFTPLSFLVRPLQVTIKDQAGSKAIIKENFGFFIEPDKGVEKRLKKYGLEEKKFDDFHGEGFLPENLNPLYLNFALFFNYLYANGDYRIDKKVVRNFHIFQSPADAPNFYVPIPYDFDWTQMVRELYADYGRGIVGQCGITQSQFSQLVTHFKGKRSELYQLLERDSWLSTQEKAQLRTQIFDIFFAYLNDPKFEKKMGPGKNPDRCTDVSTD